MGLSALRIAAVPLAVAFLLPSLSASPAPDDPGSRRTVRAALKFQEQYADRLVRVREDGESWLEEFPTERYRIKAVIPFDRDLVDVSTFGPETEFWFDMGETYYGGSLGEDPRYVPGARSARIVVDDEEWYDGNDNDHVRPITIVNLKWTEEKWTIQVVQRPYKDSENWESDGFYIAALDWAYPDEGEDTEVAEDPDAVEEEDPNYTTTVRFSEALDAYGYFSFGNSGVLFSSRYGGVSKLRHVVIDAEEGAEFDLANVRLRGTGSVGPRPEGDGVDPTLDLEGVEEQRDDAGVLEGLYVSGSCLDAESGLYAVTARVDGGPPIVLWFGGFDELGESFFDGYVPVTSPSGTIAITVFDMAKNSKTIAFPYGAP